MGCLHLDDGVLSVPLAIQPSSWSYTSWGEGLVRSGDLNLYNYFILYKTSFISPKTFSSLLILFACISFDYTPIG